jgi:hypothetical protein
LVALPAPPEGPLQNDLPTPVQPLRIPTSSGTDRAHSLRAPPHFIS